MKAFKIKSELTEKQVEAEVASYLGWVSSPEGRRFSLVDVNEQQTGADKLFNRFVPIYLQFKVSQGLRPLEYPALTPFTGLPNIREFRRQNDLFDNPTLYFKLREKAKDVADLQHNVLFQLSQLPNTYAIYVAPLTLIMEEYEELLGASFSRFLHDPFYYSDPQNLRLSGGLFQLHRVPILRGHISIPPYCRVDHANHYFSFAPSGSDIAFHSGQIVSRPVKRLSNFLYDLYRTAPYALETGYNIGRYVEIIKKLDFTRKWNFNDSETTNSLRDIVEFGRMLDLQYDIKQMFLVPVG